MLSLAPGHPRGPGTDESGFTMVEVLVAMLLIVIATFSLIDALVASGRLTHRSQRQVQAVAYGQAQIESLRARTWTEMALNARPAHTGTGTLSGDNNPTNPDYYVSTDGLSFKVLTKWQDYTSTAGPGSESLVVNPAGTIPATAAIPASTGISGVVHYYVTQVPTLTVTDPLGGIVGGLAGPNQRRLTLAIVLTGQSAVGPNKPIWVTSTVTNPQTCPLGSLLAVVIPGCG